MSDIITALMLAVLLIATLDVELVDIVGRSLYVSLTAMFAAAAIGLPLGAIIAVYRFPGRRLVIIALNSLMGLPPVFVGLMVYLLLSLSLIHI